MKNKITKSITLILLTAGAAILLYSCNSNNRYAGAYIVMIDQTDSLLVKPDEGASKRQLEQGGKWDGKIFRLTTISDVDFNYTYQLNIPPACEYLSNSYDRADELEKFYLGIDTAFQATQTTPIGRTRSSIYLPLVRELKLLTETNAERKILVIYSDLMEFSNLENFYDPEILNELKSNRQSIQQRFEKEAKLPDLKGIEIFIIFQPRDNPESVAFDIVSNFYKTLLEKQGAKVTISANLV